MYTRGSQQSKSKEKIIKKNKKYNKDIITFSESLDFECVIDILSDGGLPVGMSKIGIGEISKGCELSLMSVTSFDNFDINTLEKKPYIIKDDKNSYQIFGYKEGKWQLTNLDSMEIDFEWGKANQIVFISNEDKFFEILKQCHTKISKRDELIARFQEKNEKVKIEKVVGENNVVIFLKNYQSVILISKVTPSVREMISAVKNYKHVYPEWLSTEYQFYRSSENAKYFKSENKLKEKLYPSELNNFDKNQFISISVIESFPASLISQVKNLNDDHLRIELACNVGKQICEMLDDLHGSKCIWTDLKIGNILLRENVSNASNASNVRIGVSDIKGFLPYKQVLLQKVTPYESINNELIIRNDEDFYRKSETLKGNQFLLKISTNNINDVNALESIEYAVRDFNGKLIKGKISPEEIKNKFKENESDKDYEEKYNKFINQLCNENSKEPIDNKNSKVLFSIAADQEKAPRFVYEIKPLDLSQRFLSSEFLLLLKDENNRYEIPDIAREEYFKRWGKEYSYQLAVMLYYIATKREKMQLMEGEVWNPEWDKDADKDFNFNQPVFESDQGRKLADLILELSKHKFEERKSYREARDILSDIISSQPNVNEKEKTEIEETPLQRSKSKRQLVRAYSKIIKDNIDPNKSKKTDKEGIDDERIVSQKANTENIIQGSTVITNTENIKNRTRSNSTQFKDSISNIESKPPLTGRSSSARRRNNLNEKTGEKPLASSTSSQESLSISSEKIEPSSSEKTESLSSSTPKPISFTSSSSSKPESLSSSSEKRKTYSRSKSLSYSYPYSNSYSKSRSGSLSLFPKKTSPPLVRPSELNKSQEVKENSDKTDNRNDSKTSKNKK